MRKHLKKIMTIIMSLAMAMSLPGNMVMAEDFADDLAAEVVMAESENEDASLAAEEIGESDLDFAPADEFAEDFYAETAAVEEETEIRIASAFAVYGTLSMGRNRIDVSDPEIVYEFIPEETANYSLYFGEGLAINVYDTEGNPVEGIRRFFEETSDGVIIKDMNGYFEGGRTYYIGCRDLECWEPGDIYQATVTVEKHEDGREHKLGNNLFWSFQNGVITIRGEGEMDDQPNGYSWRFSYLDETREVVIEDGVTTIGTYAFEEFPNLEKVTLGNAVNTIGYRAFADCPNLKEINIPDSVENIYSSFVSCPQITTVDISIQAKRHLDIRDIFRGTIWLANLRPDIEAAIQIGENEFRPLDNPPHYSFCVQEDGVYQFTLPADSLLEFYTEDWNIVSYETRINDDETIYRIRLNADTTYYVKVVIPDATTITIAFEKFVAEGRLCEGVFWRYGDGELHIFGSGEMPDRLEVEEIPWNNMPIQKVIIEDGILSITRFLFFDRADLESVVIADSVEWIGSQAFAHCYNLTDVTIPDTLLNSGIQSIFQDAPWLTEHRHQYDTEVLEEATCYSYLKYNHTCLICGESYLEEVLGTQRDHSFTEYVYNNDATYDADGTMTAVCEFGCGETDTKVAEGTKLTRIANIITAANVTKTASVKDQSFSINAKRNGSGKLTYSSNNKSVKVSSTGVVTIAKKFVGKATITIKVAANGKYKAASKKITVTVNPNKTTLSSLANTKGAKLVIKWAKNTVGCGYQIQYSTDKNFKNAVKTVNVTKNGTVSKTISKLTKGKIYFVRIRSLKTVSKVKYYSAWSTVKSIKITK